jgi:hypothetical protein
MTKSWQFTVVDPATTETGDLLEDLRDLRHAGRPIHVAWLPEYEMYLIAHESITPQKALIWWNEYHKDEPEAQLTTSPVLEM